MTDRPTLPDSPRPDPRPRPAPVGTIVDMRDAPPTDLPGPQSAVTGAPQPPVESTLVGAGGGLPPMSRRESDGAEPGEAAGESDVNLDAEIVDVSELTIDAPHVAPGAPKIDRQPEGSLRAEREPRPDPSPIPPAPVPPAPVPPPSPARRRGGFLPLFLGGVCAAALGAGAAWWAIPRLPARWQPVAASRAPDDGAIAATVRAELDARVPAIENRAAEAAAAAAGKAAQASLVPADQGPLIEAAQKAGADAAARLIAEAPAGSPPDANVGATLAAQAGQLADLAARLDALAQQPAAQQPAASVDLAPLQAQVNELMQRPALDPAAAERLARLAADAEAASARITEAARQAEARLAEAEARGAELSAAADQAAQRARAAAAAVAIGEAVQAGTPTGPALAQLQQAGVQPPAALTVEVPTLDTLIAEFPGAARAAVRADLRSESASGKGSIVGNFLRAQTGARSVTPREGTDADAVLSRAGVALQRGDVAQALAELDALPEPSRPAMEGWAAKARAHAEAQAALGALTAPAGPGDAEAAPEPAPAAAPAPAPAAPGSADARASTDPAPAAQAAPAPSN